MVLQSSYNMEPKRMRFELDMSARQPNHVQAHNNSHSNGIPISRPDTFVLNTNSAVITTPGNNTTNRIINNGVAVAAAATGQPLRMAFPHSSAGMISNLNNMQLMDIRLTSSARSNGVNGGLNGSPAGDQPRQINLSNVRVVPSSNLPRSNLVPVLPNAMANNISQNVLPGNPVAAAPNGITAIRQTNQAVVLPTYNLQPPPQPFSSNFVRMPSSVAPNPNLPTTGSTVHSMTLPCVQIRIGLRKFKPIAAVIFKDDGILFTLKDNITDYTYAPVLLNARAILKCRANLGVVGYPVMFLSLEASCLKQIRNIFGLKEDEFSSTCSIELGQCITIFPTSGSEAKSQSQHLMQGVKAAFDVMLKKYPRSTPILEEISHDQVIDFLLSGYSSTDRGAAADHPVGHSINCTVPHPPSGVISSAAAAAANHPSVQNAQHITPLGNRVTNVPNDRPRAATGDARTQNAQGPKRTSVVTENQSKQSTDGAPLLVVPPDPEQWRRMQKDLMLGGIYHAKMPNGQRSYCLWNGTQLVPLPSSVIVHSSNGTGLVHNTEVQLHCKLVRFGTSLLSCVGQVRVKADESCGIYFTVRDRNNKLAEVSILPVDIIKCQVCFIAPTSTIYLSLVPACSDKLSNTLSLMDPSNPNLRPYDSKSIDSSKMHVILFISHLNRDQEEALRQLKFSVSTSHVKKQSPMFENIDINKATSHLCEIYTGSSDAGGRYQVANCLYGPKGYDKLVEALSMLSVSSTESHRITNGEVMTVDDDDDIIMTQEELGVKCPYTQQVMKEPVKNTKCGHNYEKQAILEFISLKKGNARCPYAGCGNRDPLTSADLEDNITLKEYIESKMKEDK